MATLISPTLVLYFSTGRFLKLTPSKLPPLLPTVVAAAAEEESPPSLQRRKLDL
jgi:hypothetical protein